MEENLEISNRSKSMEEDMKAFCEFLSHRQPPRSLSESTADDAIEYLLTLPSDRFNKAVSRLSKAIDRDHPFSSPMVRTFLQERVKLKEDGDKKQGGKSDDDKEILFEKYLTTSDLSNLNMTHVAADVGKYFLLATEPILRVEDEEGKPWQFGFSYLNSYVLTKGWSNYVKEKQLGAGDFVFLQRLFTDTSRLFIGFRRCEAVLGQCQDLTSLATSSEKLKEVETPLQLRSHEHSVTGFDSILVIYCGDNQDSEERYFISYISKDLYHRGFTPLRYDLTRSTLSGGLETLHSSRVGIIIFSKNYVCSRQCLGEFVAIMDHSKANNLVLIPVFFKVEVTDIRCQHGSFGRAFSRLEDSVLASQVPTLTAINKYQYMKGDEVILAKNIVSDICLLLSSETNMKLRGRLQMNSILSLLKFSQSSAPHIVGLWGMAGIGKTTIAREIFRTQAERYDVCYFLPDFQIVCQTRGLSHLRDEFFSKICGEEKVTVDACDTKLGFLRDRFLSKKILIVLDGVSNARDAEFLVGGFDWLSGGHTLILTSRNRQVLVHCNSKEIYEIQKLSEDESLHLWSQFATEQNWTGRTSFVSQLVNYASGIPLVLCVVGSSLHQCINDDKQHLKGLRQHPLVEIQDAFERSFSVLDGNEKNTFLDLACFFRGENKDHVVNILDGCGFLTELGIFGLIDESLVSIVDNKIEMPTIFQDTGRFVVCQESNETGKRSRLWDPTDIVDVLTNNSGTVAIEGIFFDASGLTVELSPTAFEKMYRLRLLKIYCPTSKNHCNVSLPKGLYSLPDELRLLHWERCPLGTLPRSFNPKNIVELNMPYSNMTKLWKGTKNLENLRRVILSHSRQLIKFPRLSKARNLEHIDLEGCTSLVKVNSSFLHHHKLTFLNLKDCSHLQIMPTTVHLEALDVLNLSGCSELEDIPDFSPNLKKLYLAGTAITEVPSSIGGLTRLVTLDLENCNRLQHVPPEIRNLNAVVTLSAKRPASSMDLSRVGETAPPYKRWRLKTVIESVILSLRKRKRENSVSRVNEETGEEKEVREKLVDGDNFFLKPTPQPLSQSLITPDLRSPNENSGQPLPQANSSAELAADSAGDEPARTLKVWTFQLHKRFVDALAHLGIKNADPKTIMQLMGVDGLTRENVASHLQMYRLYLKRMQSPGEGNVVGESDHLFGSSHVPTHFLHPSARQSSVNFTSQGNNNRKAMDRNQSMLLAAQRQMQAQQELHELLSRSSSLHLHSQVANHAEDLETHHLNKVGLSSSVGDSSSDLVEAAATKKSTIHKNASSMASETRHFNPLGYSSSVLVEASTVCEITHTNVGGDTCDSLDDEEELHL